MVDNPPATTVPEEEPSEATLIFYEQADGRKVARLPGGKVVLIKVSEIDRVRHGHQWRVRLLPRDTFYIAEPIEQVPLPRINPVLSADIAKLILARPAAEPGAVAKPASVVPASPPAPGPDVTPAPAVSIAEPVTVIAKAPGRPATAPLSSASRIDPSRVVGMNDRVAMFIDGANMDFAARMAGYFIDYKKARQYFLAHGLFYAAFYYIADFTAKDPLQQRYLDFLSHSDYIVRRKAVKVIRDPETGEQVTKANVDTELVLDLINTADNYDLAFLFSGDSDFERAVDLLRSRGKRVYIVTAKPAASRELCYVADKPIFFLEDFKAELQRDDRTMA
jgi:uncharacterized LabA/DUF88 family protein